MVVRGETERVFTLTTTSSQAAAPPVTWLPPPPPPPPPPTLLCHNTDPQDKMDIHNKFLIFTAMGQKISGRALKQELIEINSCL